MLEERIGRPRRLGIGRARRLDPEKVEPLPAEPHAEPVRRVSLEPHGLPERLGQRLGRSLGLETEPVAVEGLRPGEVGDGAADGEDRAHTSRTPRRFT
ncbi:hypothetical protein IFDJLNFL_5691 [Methylobacterium dankookense]|uniref:Uncharacterized protein n=1 Tax=Methylobacterium dankookense TaxID=560405 RepID=A0ABQ4RPL6_9HYPH|nr:hypothetical protein IFDJLNFL_5691 [Methylobacterium dankookense]